MMKAMIPPQVGMRLWTLHKEKKEERKKEKGQKKKKERPKKIKRGNATILFFHTCA